MDLSLKKPEPEKREKKTRRRLRLSCVECTKRRQKCDRNYPCSLCVTRGVSHLCRWETVPVARPTPARPPEGINRSANAHDAIIQELTARIATLEQALAHQSTGTIQQPQHQVQHQQQSSRQINPNRSSTLHSPHPSASYVSPNSHHSTLSNSSIIHTSTPSSGFTSPTPGNELNGSSILFSQHSPNASGSPNTGSTMTPSFSPEPFRHVSVQPEMGKPTTKSAHESPYNKGSTLTHSSHIQNDEYVARGSVTCTLHSLNSRRAPRFTDTKSTDSTPIHRSPKISFSPHSSLSSGLERLLQTIPPVAVCNNLIHDFFTQVNWRFGVPEQWFRASYKQMWNTLQHPNPRTFPINSNWLSLFYAVLASIPCRSIRYYLHQLPQYHQHQSNTEWDVESILDDYFACSLSARRLAEDEHLSRSTPIVNDTVDGTVMGCLGVPMLCCYLAERGRVGEAWKMVGNAIRNAEAVGMHRDPAWGLWQIMSEDERLLRRRVWWDLVICDKLYSFLLGRPKMIRKEIFDVALPSLDDPDANENPFNLYQAVRIQLSGIVGEALEKCYSVEYPSCPVFLEIDQKFHQWRENLPAQFQLETMFDDRGTGGMNTAYAPGYMSPLGRHCYTLHTWYLLIRMKLHSASITGPGRPAQQTSDTENSRQLCIHFAMKLIQLQCETWEYAMQCEDGLEVALPGSHWYFEGCLSLAEGAMTLISTLARYPWPEKLGEAERLIDRALAVSSQVSREEPGKKGEAARMAVKMISDLASEHWWSARSPGSGGGSASSPPEEGSNIGMQPLLYGQINTSPNQLATQRAPSTAPSSLASPATMVGELAPPIQLYSWYPTSYEPAMLTHTQHHDVNSLRENTTVAVAATGNCHIHIGNSNQGWKDNRMINLSEVHYRPD